MVAGVYRIKEVQENARAQALPEDFAWFWSEYPRKVAKGAAYRAWLKTKDHRPEIEELIAAVNRYAEACQFKDKEFVKHPATWLNGWCWADE